MSTRIEVDRLRELIAANAQLVEVLPADEYEDEHLPGSVSIPIKQLDDSAAAQLDRSRPIVVYCWDYI